LAETPHRPSWRNQIERHLGRELALLPPDPTRQDIARTLARIDSPAMRNQCLAIVSAVYRWGIGSGLCDDNPAYGLRKRRLTPRSRVLSLPELRLVWAACRADNYGRAIRTLILTGLRLREVADLDWREIEADRIVIPAERMKGARVHVVPLTDGVRSLLGGPRTAGLVFGGHSMGSRAKAALDARSGVSGWCHHSLRHSFATNAAELGLADDALIDLCLAHARPGVAGRYNRALRLEERRGLAEAWARVVTAAEAPPGPGDRPSGHGPSGGR
jgi:integrase